MIIILFLLFISTMALGDSTGTITTLDLIPPTTYQILLDTVIVGTNENKLAAIDVLLEDSNYYESIAGVKIDEDTGQSLLNDKTYITRVVRNKRLGRTYIDYIDYRKYEVK